MGCESFEDGGAQFTCAEDENWDVGGGYVVWKRGIEAEMGIIWDTSLRGCFCILVEVAKRRALLIHIGLRVQIER